MPNNDTKTNNPKKYTKLSLVWEFLKGSRGYFAISIIATLLVNGLDMLTPQIIRTTVDSVIGMDELKSDRRHYPAMHLRCGHD